jgi:hypothetical protein
MQELNEAKLDCTEILIRSINDSERHVTSDSTFYKVFVKVWGRISKSEHKDELLKRLNEEIIESSTSCFTGKLTRLINTLNGYFDDIQIKISENDQINNIIISVQRRFLGSKDNEEKDYESVIDEIRIECRKELKERGYTDDVIDQWLQHL